MTSPVELGAHAQIPGIETAAFRIGYGTYHLLDKLNASDALASFTNAFDVGVNLFDSSDNYGTELVIGRAVTNGELPRDKIIIATKTGLGTTLQEQRRWSQQGRRYNTDPTRIHQQVDNSLRVLGDDVGVIDLYQLHIRDPAIEHAAHAEVMAELIERGKIRAWGVSNYSNRDLADLLAACDINGLPRPATSQAFHNMLDPTSISETQFASSEGLVVLGHSPLLKGVLTDKRLGHLTEAFDNISANGTKDDQKVLEDIAPVMKKLVEVARVAEATGSSLAKVAIGWTLQDPNLVTLTAPTDQQYLADAMSGFYSETNSALDDAIADLRADEVALELFQQVSHQLIRQIRGY